MIKQILSNINHLIWFMIYIVSQKEDKKQERNNIKYYSRITSQR